MSYKTDIEIAQSTAMRPITEIAAEDVYKRQVLHGSGVDAHVKVGTHKRSAAKRGAHTGIANGKHAAHVGKALQQL